MCGMTHSVFQGKPWGLQCTSRRFSRHRSRCRILCIFRFRLCWRASVDSCAQLEAGWCSISQVMSTTQSPSWAGGVRVQQHKVLAGYVRVVSMVEVTEATKWLQSCWMFEVHGHRPLAVHDRFGFLGFVDFHTTGVTRVLRAGSAVANCIPQITTRLIACQLEE